MTETKRGAKGRSSLKAAPIAALDGQRVDRPTVVYAQDGCVMAHWKGISLVIWGTAATLPLVDELTRLAESVASMYPRGSSVHLVINGAGPPTREARAALWGLSKRAESRHVCTAACVEGNGFWASLIRSLVTSLDLVTGRRLKLRAFTDIEALADWLMPIHAEALGLDLSAADLVQALSWLRAHPAVSDQAAARSTG
jgi:hypothetical protein